VALLSPVANRFESAGAGCIAVITSVAGDRGRQSNYLYGAARGGLDRFLEGLRKPHRAIERRRDIAYIPWFWRPIIALVRALPESVFKRLRL
jgi:short-subunit dehydrogenase